MDMYEMRVGWQSHSSCR